MNHRLSGPERRPILVDESELRSVRVQLPAPKDSHLLLCLWLPLPGLLSCNVHLSFQGQRLRLIPDRHRTFHCQFCLGWPSVQLQLTAPAAPWFRRWRDKPAWDTFWIVQGVSSVDALRCELFSSFQVQLASISNQCCGIEGAVQPGWEDHWCLIPEFYREPWDIWRKLVSRGSCQFHQVFCPRNLESPSSQCLSFAWSFFAY